MQDSSDTNKSLDHLIFRAETAINEFKTICTIYVNEQKADKERIIDLYEKRLDESENKFQDTKNQLDQALMRARELENANGNRNIRQEENKRPDVAEEDNGSGSQAEDDSSMRKEASARKKEIRRFRRKFAENGYYSKEQRDFLTMCFTDPEKKKRMSFKEISLFASPELTVNQMQALRDKIVMERTIVSEDLPRQNPEKK